MSIWLLFLAALIWFVVIMYWQVNDIQPTARDIAVYLGVLPVGVFLTLVLLKNGMASASSKAEQAGAAQSSGAQPDSGVQASEATPVAGPPLAVLAGALRLPAGASADEVEQAIADPRQASLHKRLKDEAGFPVFAAWVEDLDTEAVEQRMDDAVPERKQSGQRLAEEQLRALSLLQPVMEDLMLQVSAEQLLATPESQHDVRRREPLPLPTLEIRLLLASGWSQDVQRDVRGWVLAEAEATGLPLEQITVETAVVDSGAEVWAQLELVARQPINPAAPVYHMLLACDSMIGAQRIARLQQAGGLMSGRNPEGLVPGEGAVGVLLMAADAEGSFLQPPQAIARGLVIAQRGISWQTRSAVRQMSEMLAQALAFAGAGKQDVNAVVSDSDQRKSRSSAVSGVVAVELPHIELESGCLSIGTACGHLGHVAALAVLTLSAVRAQRDDASILALAVSEASERVTVVLMPPAKPTPETEAVPNAVA